MNKALFPDLNDAIKRRFKSSGLILDVRDQAPSSIGEVVQAFNGRVIKVYAGGSDNTIYADPLVNYMFRALHDREHISLQADFSLDGEKQVAYEQAKQFGDALAPIILAEVVGQAAEFFRSGQFPSDQVQFIMERLKVAA
jgi:hypothetical protein